MANKSKMNENEEQFVECADNLIRCVAVEVIKLIWEQVEMFYGTRIADLMKESKYLKGITVNMVRPDGKEPSIEDIRKGNVIYDFDQYDLDRAYRDVTK
jgi:hypothetical protein